MSPNFGMVAKKGVDARTKSGHDNEKSHDHFANSAMASSANTSPVIAIGATGAFAASSALEIMI
jgi:hypothetical protein